MHEEEALGKAYDTRLLRRLWPTSGPVSLAGAADPGAGRARLFLSEIAPAWIIKTGLDGVILPGRRWSAPRRARRPAPGSTGWRR